MKFKKVEYEKYLVSVENPARYIANEPEAYNKNISSETINFCFAFPDVYEVGFSHLGIKILYSVINNQKDAAADRVYAPWTDFGDILLQNNLPLFALESGVPVKDFDVLGITLQSELTFTNVLYILKLSQIPILAKDRDENYPLVIGGGPAISNPEPMAIFFDAIMIGDAEEAILEIKDAVKKTKNLSKHEKLLELSKIEGLYIPALYNFKDGKIISDIVKHPIKKRYFLDFNNPDFMHKNQLVPWLKPTHERYVIEIMRGCTRGCRFCHAGMFYRPTRERDPKVIVENLLENVEKTGWTEVALTSLSSSDYTNIKPLLFELYKKLQKSKTRISLPSLRVDSLDNDIISLLNAMHQTGLTIAPEAGSQRLRDIINKNISEDEIIRGIKIALENGWQVIKLYFMVGLPFEEDDDIYQLILLIKKIVELSKKRLKINITLSPFVPKPFTPFQWEKMTDTQTLLKRIFKIKSALKHYRFIKIKYHTIETSILETIIGRGNRDVGMLILKAFENGAIFDGWAEKFDFDYWKKAANSLNMDLDKFLEPIDTNDYLPWEHIDVGIDKNFLLRELENAKQKITTPDCRTDKCSLCGVCNKEVLPDYNKKMPLPEIVFEEERKNLQLPNYHYRVFYAKTGRLRFISHLDMLRMIQRFIRTMDIPLKYSGGYNIRPQIALSPPLSIGIEGLNEYFDITLFKKLNTDLLTKKLVEKFASIFKISKVEFLQDKKMLSMDYFPREQMKVIFKGFDTNILKEKLDKYLKAKEWIFERTRKGKTKQRDMKPLIESISLKDDTLRIIKKRNGLSVFDILQSIFTLERENTNELTIIRERFLR